MKKSIKSLLASAMIAATMCTTTCAAPMTTSASIHLDFWNTYYKNVTVIWSQYCSSNGTPIDGYEVMAYNDDYLWTGSISGWFFREMMGVKSIASYGTKTKDINADYLDDSAFTRYRVY